VRSRFRLAGLAPVSFAARQSANPVARCRGANHVGVKLPRNLFHNCRSGVRAPAVTSRWRNGYASGYAKIARSYASYAVTPKNLRKGKTNISLKLAA
jgi:hypothetical protein